MRYSNWRSGSNTPAVDIQHYRIFVITRDKVRMYIARSWGQIRQHVERADAYLVLLGGEVYDQYGDESELVKIDQHLDELYYDMEQRA